MKNTMTGDTPAMTFWRAMCDAADLRLLDTVTQVWPERSGARTPGAYEPERYERQRAAILLTSYCRRRYWQAFYASREGTRYDA
jgi:hypothetical protein